MKIAVILLAGGIGRRFGASTPKQFLQLGEKPIAQYSFDLFLEIPAVREIVVVCAESYRHFFPLNPIVRFALPGERRQDSVGNGLAQVSTEVDLICVHDAARPLVRKEDVLKVFSRAFEVGAAALGVRVKPTIKRCDPSGKVEETLHRENLWEVQTPQVIRATLFREAYAHSLQFGVNVTDDLSLVEKAGYPVYLVQGAYSNLKITTSDDLDIAEKWLTGL